MSDAARVDSTVGDACCPWEYKKNEAKQMQNLSTGYEYVHATKLMFGDDMR